MYLRIHWYNAQSGNGKEDEAGERLRQELRKPHIYTRERETRPGIKERRVGRGWMGVSWKNAMSPPGATAQ